MNNVELLDLATIDFRNGRAASALASLDQILRSGASTCDASAYLLRGLIYEYGGIGVETDLQKAVLNYRSASNLLRNEDATTFLYMARALMKQGQEFREAALKCINEAAAIRHTPEVNLAYARFHEEMSGESLKTAKRYFRAAALRGRFAGFFGYSSVLRRTGHPRQAIAVDTLRILIGPILSVLLGKRATWSFNGY